MLSEKFVCKWEARFKMDSIDFRKPAWLAITPILLCMCISDNDGKGSGSRPTTKLSGIYEITTGSMESMTYDDRPVIKPRWFAILDSSSVREYIQFRADSIYLISSDFGDCTWYGYTAGKGSYSLVDSILHISETNNSGTFQADKVVIRVEKTDCEELADDGGRERMKSRT